MDDDLVCLIGLTLLADPSCRGEPEHVVISQLILSLYLMTQCQMKLHHPVTSLAQTLDYIDVARHTVLSQILTLDQLLPKLTEEKILRHCDGLSTGAASEVISFSFVRPSKDDSGQSG